MVAKIKVALSVVDKALLVLGILTKAAKALVAVFDKDEA